MRFKKLCIKSLLLSLDFLPHILSTSQLEFFFPFPHLKVLSFQTSQALPSILPPAFRSTLHYHLTHLHLHQGQLKKSRSTTFGHVDVDSDCRMSSTVPPRHGRDQSDVGILYVNPGGGFVTHKLRLSEVMDDPKYGDTDVSLCNDIEKQLGHVPGQEALDDCYWEFSWEHRTLVKVPNLKADPSDGVKRADYLMYVCLDEVKRLKRNSYLEGLVPGSPKVYGGAFVFKKTTKSGEKEGSKRIAAYLQNSDDIFNQGIEASEFEERILTKLMEAVCHHASANQSVKSPPH